MSLAAMIAVIDDDESVRFAVENLVSSVGHEVRTFASAESFLASEAAKRTSCLISDVQMPGMQGLELQELLRAKGRNLPIIFITAFPDPVVRQRALSAGAVGFLGKPFEPDELIGLLEKVVAA
ncbi:MAG TPA: response regulator [Terriglobales bacterium]|nr:response regulator [Terriglobales bacterium]